MTRRMPTAPAPDSEAERVLAARAGNRTCLAWLHERYARMVHGILLSRVPPGDADDLVQDVFVTVLERIHGLENAQGVGAWIAQITRNRAIDFHRRRRSTVDLPESLTERERPTAEAAEVLEHIRSLPDAYRETLALRLVEGMTGPEIAERTGLTPGSVRVNLHRGMKLLRERLGTEATDES